MKCVVAYSLVLATSLTSASLLESRNSEKYVSLPFSCKIINDSPSIDDYLKMDILWRRKKRDVQPIRLKNNCQSYEINITVGTPGQLQTVVIDTGSSDLWVFGEAAPNATHKYNPDKSSTYQYNNWLFDTAYDMTTTSHGMWAMDTVTIGGVDLVNQSFGISGLYDAILGVGLSIASDFGPYNNVPQSLVSQGYINRNVYSLFLSDIRSSSGSLLFGAVDSAKYTGPLRTVGLTSDVDLAVRITGISVGDKTIHALFDAVLNSGSPFSYLPPRIVDDIALRYNARYDDSLQTYLVSQLDESPLIFNLSGITISMKPDEIFFRELDHNGQYALTILSNAVNGGANILGVNFLRSAYVVFDLERLEISIAQSSFDSTRSNIIPVIGDVPGATHVSTRNNRKISR